MHVATVVVGQRGRLVIPAELLADLGLVVGDQLNLTLDGDRLVLEQPADAVAELRRLRSTVAAGRSLVDELLAERGGRHR